MADPPPYEESASEYGRAFHEQKTDQKTDQKTPPCFRIREEIGASRSQHVAAIVARLLPHIQTRARSGLSKSILLILPSDQALGREGQLVWDPEDNVPILIQLESRHDNSEFWSQGEVLEMFHRQMLAAVSDEVPTAPPIETPPSEQIIPAPKSGWFGRKAGKVAATAKPAGQPVEAPVKVDVQPEELDFRTETDFGLFETLRRQSVMVTVEVR